MLSLGVVGSILLGIAVIIGLIKEGEMGCMGAMMVIALIFVLIFGLGVAILIGITEAM